MIAHDIPVNSLTPAELNHRKELWQEALTKISRKENTPLVIRVNPMNQVINTNYLVPSGGVTMKALQRALQLRWEQVDGIQVFTHPWKADTNENRLIVADWINALPPDQQAALFEKGIPLENLYKKHKMPCLIWGLVLFGYTHIYRLRC